MAANKEIAELFTKRRFCYFVPIDGFVAGRGYRPSIVFEGEPGHHPVGTWPYEGKPGQVKPWFWGEDYDAAVKIAEEMNDRLGVSKKLALDIVASSMSVSGEPRRG
jgi:hypothetical protein